MQCNNNLKIHTHLILATTALLYINVKHVIRSKSCINDKKLVGLVALYLHRHARRHVFNLLFLWFLSFIFFYRVLNFSVESAFKIGDRFTLTTIKFLWTNTSIIIISKWRFKSAFKVYMNKFFFDFDMDFNFERYMYYFHGLFPTTFLS